MKAVSIQQPWASLIAHGIKDIENRTWRTHFRGRVYVHASAKQYGTPIELLNENQIKSLQNGFCELHYPKSAIIGEVDIVDCVINHPSIWAEKTPESVKNYKGNPFDKPPTIYNWVLANPVFYEKPILNVKGKLSFWEPTPNQICRNCGDKYFGQEPEYCCNGRDCGCLGMPIEPDYCDSCLEKHYKK